MHQKIRFLFLFLSTFGILQSQKKKSPSSEQISQAVNLSEIYEDDIVILNSSQTFEFELNRKQDLISVLQKTDEEIINTSERSHIKKYVFYDKTSNVSEFEMLDQEGKSLGLDVSDDYYQSDDIFYSDARVKHMDVIFPSKGTVLNFKMEKEYGDIKYFTRIIFQDEYPIQNKEVKLIVPNWLKIEFKEFNFGNYSISLKKELDEKAGTTIYYYSIRNLEAIKKEYRSPGISHTAPHILVLAKAYYDKGEEKILFKETRDLYKWYKSLVNEMDESDNDALKNVVARLTEGAESDDEKIKNIYYWVQDNIRYIAFEDGIAGFKPDESQNVLRKKYGDCKGMANLLKQMLVIAGYDARLTWIGTNNIAYDYSLPNLAVDNHMICSLKKEGGWLYLDPTEKFISIKDNAERIQGRPVLIENGKEYIQEEVPIQNPETNKQEKFTRLQLEDNILKGKVIENYTGQSKSNFLYGYHQIKNSDKDRALKYYINSGNKDVLVGNIKTSDLTDRDADLNLDYEVEFNNMVSSFGNEIYIDLDNEKEFSNLKLKERKYAYRLPYKMDVTSVVEFEVPQGYKISKLPKPVDESTQNFRVHAEYSLKGNLLQYKKHFVFQNSLIDKNDFEVWSRLSKSLNDLYNHQIILTAK